MEEEKSKTTTNSELTQKDWLGVVLEEFKASRAENLEAGKHAQTTFQISIVGFSILITSTINIWNKEVVPDLMLFVFIPLFSYLVSVVWVGEIARRMRIAHFVHKEIEPKINAFFPDLPAALTWEKYLRDNRDNNKNLLFKWNYYAALSIFLGIPLTSVVVGNIKVWASISTCRLIAYNVVEIGVFTLALVFLLTRFTKFN